MRDLEIRGAGNVLGTAQSGHIVAVGFDLYCQLLRRAVAQLKGGERPRVEVAVDFDFLMTKEAAYRALPPGDQEAAAAAFLPARFLPETKERIKGYRDLANAAGRDALDRLRRDWRDRFGPLPVPVENLFRVAGIKVVAASQNVTKVAVADRKLMLTRRGDYLLVDGKFPRLRESATGDERLEEVLDLLRRL
jgi:transcription-repair coupling factor (superfamily II helicase)